ncbi:putative ribonuclease H protein-like [Capsicum annuum]|nr:putative ribonuclease H protein-like [Capsicum annuum]
MLGHGYSRSMYDSCVYFRKLNDGSFIYLLLYVDDMLIAAKDLTEIHNLKSQLKSEFEMKDLGAAKKILGMEIRRNREARWLFLTQKKYLEKVLERFGMKEAKPVSTLLAAHFKLSAAQSPQSEEEESYMAQVPYSSVAGSIMYAMVCTRPDISHAVSVVSRYMAYPGKAHWQAVKWILRYLRGTSNVCLEFGRNTNTLVGVVDSDYAGDLDKRRLLTGYVFCISGCAISWKATLHYVVALSTTEIEYMVVTEAIKEYLWLKGLFAELSPHQGDIIIFCDSQSAIHLTKDQMYHERAKHIDIKYHFILKSIIEGKHKSSFCSDPDYLVYDHQRHELFIVTRYIAASIDPQDGHLVLPEDNLDYQVPYKTLTFDVFRLDFTNDDRVELQYLDGTLGNRAFFVGSNTVFAISITQFPELRPNFYLLYRQSDLAL